MTHTEIIKKMIKHLANSPLEWKNNEEIFELLFYPIPYGISYERERNAQKKPIIDLFKIKEEGRLNLLDSFDKNTFNKLANNIPCYDKQQEYRKDIELFLIKQLNECEIKYNEGKLKQLVDQLLCKKKIKKIIVHSLLPG